MSVEFSRLDAVGIGATLAALAVAALSYPHLPETIAIHWNASGTADNYASKAVGLGLFVGLVAGLYLLHRFGPALDPLSRSVRSTRGYDAFVALVLAFLVSVEMLVVAWNLDLVPVVLGSLLCPPFAVLSYAIGLVVERVDRNAVVGVRTPWTLASDAVWDATHERAAPAFKLAAPLTLPGVAFAGEVAVAFAVGPMLLAAAYATGYSFVAYRRLDQPG
jgi:uncharacterized membrane protein